MGLFITRLFDTAFFIHYLSNAAALSRCCRPALNTWCPLALNRLSSQWRCHDSAMTIRTNPWSTSLRQYLHRDPPIVRMPAKPLWRNLLTALTSTSGHWNTRQCLTQCLECSSAREDWGAELEHLIRKAKVQHDTIERGHDMDGWPLHSKLCACPEISPESNYVQILPKHILGLSEQLLVRLTKQNSSREMYTLTLHIKTMKNTSAFDLRSSSDVKRRRRNRQEVEAKHFLESLGWDILDETINRGPPCVHTCMQKDHIRTLKIL